LAEAWGSRNSQLSEYEGVFERHIAVLAVALDITFAGRVEAVNPKTVFIFGNDPEQPSAEAFELRVVHPTLEDRVLDALPEVLAGRSDLPQPAAAFSRLRVNVIGDEDIHRYLGVKGT
jgi:hypothetical protein